MHHYWMATGTVDVRPNNGGIYHHVQCEACGAEKWTDKKPPVDGTAFVFTDDQLCDGRNI